MSDPYNRDYFGPPTDNSGGLKFRIDPREEIRRVVDTFAGRTRDKYGRATETEYPVMNEEGVMRSAGFLEGMVTKITHLSKYQNEERVNRQAKHFIRTWVYIVVRNRKRWEIKDLRVVVSEVEKLVYESMLRANDGFEAELTAKSIQVLEQFQHGTPEKRGGFKGLFSKGDDS